MTLQTSSSAFHQTPSHFGAVLKHDDVVSIFVQRPSRSLDSEGKNTFRTDESISPTILATEYGVSSKTIRDIWNRNTWHSVTRPYWNEAELAAEGEKIEGVVAAEKRKLGRPKGSKDAIPRMRNLKRRDISASVSNESIASAISTTSSAGMEVDEQACWGEQPPAKRACYGDFQEPSQRSSQADTSCHVECAKRHAAVSAGSLDFLFDFDEASVSCPGLDFPEFNTVDVASTSFTAQGPGEVVAVSGFRHFGGPCVESESFESVEEDPFSKEWDFSCQVPAPIAV